MYFRHLYATVQPSLEQRCDSWDNYCALFNVILGSSINMQVRGAQDPTVVQQRMRMGYWHGVGNTTFYYFNGKYRKSRSDFLSAVGQSTPLTSR